MRSSSELFAKGMTAWTQGHTTDGKSSKDYFIKAVSFFQQAVDADPVNGVYYAFLSRSHHALDDIYKAQQTAEKAVTLSPHDFECWRSLFLCYVSRWLKIEQDRGPLSGAKLLALGAKFTNVEKQLIETFVAFCSNEHVDVTSALKKADVLIDAAKLKKIRGGYPLDILKAVVEQLTTIAEEYGDTDELDDCIALAQGMIATR